MRHKLFTTDRARQCVTSEYTEKYIIPKVLEQYPFLADVILSHILASKVSEDFEAHVVKMIENFKVK